MLTAFLGFAIAPFVGLALWLFASFLASIILRLLPECRFKSLLRTKIKPIGRHA